MTYEVSVQKYSGGYRGIIEWNGTIEHQTTDTTSIDRTVQLLNQTIRRNRLPIEMIEVKTVRFIDYTKNQPKTTGKRNPKPFSIKPKVGGRQ